MNTTDQNQTGNQDEEDILAWIRMVLIFALFYSLASHFLGYLEWWSQYHGLIRPLVAGFYYLECIVGFSTREIIWLLVSGLLAWAASWLARALVSRKYREACTNMAFMTVFLYLIIGDLIGYALTYETALEFCQAGSSQGLGLTFKQLDKRDQILQRYGFTGFGEWTVEGDTPRTGCMYYVFLFGKFAPSYGKYYNYQR